MLAAARIMLQHLKNRQYTKAQVVDANELIHQRKLIGVWIAAGSALAVMLGFAWVVSSRDYITGDMTNHAIAAEWLRTLPWWDWRGWSDWLSGGQALGVHYPPLGLVWLRFTDPVYGQVIAVALGGLVLLPWGTIYLTQAMGYTRRGQRAAVGAVLVFAVATQTMYFVMPGIRVLMPNSWPAMLATVSGLFAASWAARCRRPVACGVVLGLAALLNIGIIPGIIIICIVLLVSSGASLSERVLWISTVGTTSIAVCGWWLVPFVAGSARWVRWDIPISDTWNVHRYALIAGEPRIQQELLLLVLCAITIWAVCDKQMSYRRLALAAIITLLSATLADSLGYPRADRWLPPAMLIATIAGSKLFKIEQSDRMMQTIKSRHWSINIIAALVVIWLAISLRIEILPLAGWLLWQPMRIWACSGSIAWICLLIFFQNTYDYSTPIDQDVQISADEQLAVNERTTIDAQGYQSSDDSVLQHIKRLDPNASGLVYTPEASLSCLNAADWNIAKSTQGRIRYLNYVTTSGYNQTSNSAEFIDPRKHTIRNKYHGRPHWIPSIESVGGMVSLNHLAIADALGASWYIECDDYNNISAVSLNGVMVVGVTTIPHTDDQSWHRSAVQWWVSLVADTSENTLIDTPVKTTDSGHEQETVPVPALATSPAVYRIPILTPDASAYPDGVYPTTQAASGMQLTTDKDSLVVYAEQAGWAWLRVSWDPDWRSENGTPVHKGGPGHLVIWAQEGITRLYWSIPSAVDTTAAAITVVSILATAALTILNRRRD